MRFALPCFGRGWLSLCGRLLLPVCLMISVVACARETPAPPPDTPMPQCATAYVYAPGNFIIDIASGATVVLDPAIHDFPLFCTPAEARTALHNALEAKLLPAGDWRIYLVEGDFQELACRLESGGFGLKRMAPIIDWVSEKQ